MDIFLSDSRESLVPLEMLVALDTRELVACPVSVVPLVPQEARERRYVLNIYQPVYPETVCQV